MFATVSVAQGVPASGGPEMKFDVTEINYGDILQGKQSDTEAVRVFKFTNTGNEPLIISNAKGSCGCTVPSYPKEAILPGKTANIEVRYDIARLGPFQKTVTLTTNEANPTHTLTIKGKVNPKPSEESVPASQSGSFGG
ncbi:MAG: DUF1573 domain-containing protein [Bacteroidales bacterium]|nr:DUF1573 domain-containing protein [Bacteroidales bacterium]